MEQLRQYMEGVLAWNEKVNLTAITDRDAFVQKHYIDSLLCAESLDFTESTSICDVGTGGGFPGVPLAVCYPDKEFVLMDSLQKRVKIVRELCDEIGLRNVTVIHGRAEELARKKEYRENFDLCVSRAVANMQVLSEYCLPFVKPGGYFIAYKGADCEAEISDASRDPDPRRGQASDPGTSAAGSLPGRCEKEGTDTCGLSEESRNAVKEASVKEGVECADQGLEINGNHIFEVKSEKRKCFT